MTETTTDILFGQIDKIFQVIEKNQDNQEIVKLAFETLINKCLENSIFIFPVLKNILSSISKGSLKLIEDASIIFSSFFEEFSYFTIEKILSDDFFRNQIIEICKNSLNSENNFFTINPKNLIIEKITKKKFLNYNLFNDKLDINQIESLLAKEKNDLSHLNHDFSLNKMDINILFGNNEELKKEVEMLKNKSENFIEDENENENLIKIEDLFNENYQFYEYEKDTSLNSYIEKIKNNKNKIRKLEEKSNQRIYYFHINLFLSFLEEILQMTHMSFSTQRICSSTILHLLQNYFHKILYSFNLIEIIITSDSIEKITVSHESIKSNKFIEIIQSDFVTQLIFNSIIDKVVDYSNEDYICLNKEINIQLAVNILKDDFNEIIVNDLSKKLMNLMNILYDNHNDWQPLFAILTFYKFLFLNEIYIDDKKNLFDSLFKILHSNYEDIITLIIQILDKILEANSKNMFLSMEQVSKMFIQFIKLIKKYDDIESGVKYYFNCLYNFIAYYFNYEEGKNKEEIFKQLINLMDNNFIVHSLNKQISVRVKYYEVINDLFLGGFQFTKDFLEKNILLAFQGLCIEEDKQILKIQQIFLKNILLKKSLNGINCVQILIDYSKIIFQILLTVNYTDLNNFYIPNITDSEGNSNKNELENLYRSFFVNNIQTEIIQKKNERKYFYTLPLLSLILKNDCNFIQEICINLSIYFPITTVDNLLLNHNLLFLLKLYFYYLEFLEKEENKTLILSDEIIQNLSESSILNDMQIEILDVNLRNNLISLFHNFYAFIHQQNPNNQDFSLIINTLNQHAILDLKFINDSIKSIYEMVKSTNDEKNMKICYNHIKLIKDKIIMIENLLGIPLLRQKIRAYASACLFIHSNYKKIKCAKISSITNSFLNCLKLNIKENSIFIKYILQLIQSLENKNTVSKIISIFMENSFSYFEDFFKKKKENEQIENFKFLPIKYFIKEYIKQNKLDDIKVLINNYINGITENKNRKILVLLFLLTPIKEKIQCYDFEDFKNILLSPDFKEEDVELTGNILMKGNNIFYNYTDKNMLKYLFCTLNEEHILFFNIINLVLKDDKIKTNSIDFIFTILHYINNKNEKIRKHAITIFSEQMKIISLLKFGNNYDQLSKTATNAKSLDFISKIFSQNIYDIKNLKIHLKLSLRTYQLIGINWLLFLGDYGLGLALCDDMGLGKTIQTLVSIAHATLSYASQNKKLPNSLIICPTTLILNWILESKKFFDESDLILQAINNPDDIKQYKNKKKNNNNKEPIIIYITSYEKARENTNDIFTSREFFYLVLDEAHIIKNPKTKMYQSIRKIKSERRIILTGTPIQNNVMELWSLFDFLMPGFLGNENDFEIKYHKKIHNNIKKLNLEEKLQENIFKTTLMEIRKRIKPFILRRLKIDVLKELPEKTISDYTCEMTIEQRELYEKYNKIYSDPKNNKNNSLALIDKLRKICNHPSIILKEDTNNKECKTKEYILTKSGKLNALEVLLTSLGFESSNNKNQKSTFSTYENKILIFTQFKQMCSYLETFLKEKFSTINYLTLTGDVKAKDRTILVEKFNKDPSINLMLLTTNIGGLGINLTSANIVIMYDHNWNPVKDMQAIDRAHRIGQKKSVFVYRLITVNSIEEQLISLQTFKKYIANNLVENSGVSDIKVNSNSIMESFEAFSSDKNNSGKKNNKKKGNKKISKIDEINLVNEDDEKRELLEIEYLKQLIKK